jgi:class 3 adenylate cyclase/tetratricopeptide (TPR) repeat protein
MEFDDILEHTIALLQRQGRVSYGALKRRFKLDDDYLADLKTELIEAQRLAADENGTILVWVGEHGVAPVPPAPVDSSAAQAPLTYTPPHLTEKILASRAALEGERKQVTVLFADIKDSTELIKGLDAEAAQQLLDPALHHMMDAVHRFEGTVNQVLGDGIMALFGAPIAHEDHALRACYAALAMQAAMHDYTDAVRRTHGLEMRIRVGLNAGEVVVRTIRNDLHMDYSAVGETTHLAARMEQLATPGTIRLSAATLHLVEGLVRVTALGPVPVKGLTEPVEVFELLGVSSFRRRLQAAVARGLTRFVGRQTEFAAIGQALSRAQAMHGQVVALVGEAGVGKSRLVYEVVHAHHTQGWLVLESASVSYGKATPYFPVIELLKHYAHIEDSDDVRTRRAKLTGQVLTLDDTLQDALPPLLALLEVLPADSPFLKFDPPQRRQRTLEALKRLLLRESQAQPLLLVFEDLHWIDAETQTLLDLLVDSLPTTRLLLLVNYRPEYQHGWGSKTYYTQLRLDPLLPDSAEAFLQVLLGDGAGAQHAASLQALKQLLIDRTGGNPFFLEESVRTLVETGVLAGEPGAYRLTQSLTSLQVPATVQALLAARIDRLSPEEKRLLQTAAVIGHEVPLPLLQAIADVPEAVLYRSLAQLQGAEFLYETRLFPEREYTFKHALTHEVAYGSLLQERRRTLHASIVAALEGLYPDRLAEQVDRLAYHALRGEVWDKAVTCCRQAGNKAAARSAHGEAVVYFEQALSALQQLPESRETMELGIDMRFDLRASLQSLGELARIPSCLHEAATLAMALNDQQRLWQAYSLMGQYAWLMGDQERYIELSQQALAAAETLGNFDLQVRATYYLGTAYHTLGDYPRAMDYLRRAVALVERDPFWKAPGSSTPNSVNARLYLSWSLAEVGAFTEGSARAEEALRIAEAAEATVSRIQAYLAIGLVALRHGELEKAVTALERGLGLCQSANLQFWFPRVGSALGFAYTLTGRVTEGLPLLEQAVAQGMAIGQMVFQPLWVACLAEAYLVSGRRADALVHGERALALARQHKERGNEAYALRLLGEIQTRHDPSAVEPAENYYRQALALAEELGMRPLQAHCHLGLGTLYARMDQPEQTRPSLSVAMTLYRTMEMAFWLPQAEAALVLIDKV